MNSQTTGLLVAGILFGLVALAHLLRLIFQPAITIAGYVLPLWPSVLAFLILAALCLWLLQLTHVKS